VFFTKPHKSSFQISSKLLSLPGYPYSSFLGATLRKFQEKKHELVKGKLMMTTFLMELLLNYHQRDSGNRGKFSSVIDMSARSASRRDLRDAEIKLSNLSLIVQSRSSMDKSHVHGGQVAYAAPGRAYACT